MEQSIKNILTTIDDAIASFQNDVPNIQKLVYEELQPIVKQLEVKNGKLLNNLNNLKLIGTLQNKLEQIIVSANYKASVQKFIDSFTSVSNLNNEYFGQFNNKYKPKNTLPIIKELAIGSTINDLIGQGLLGNVITPIQKILQQNITTGGSYTNFQEVLRNHILTNESGEGNLQRYTKQITTDAIHQYNAQYAETVAQDLQFNWGRYLGSALTTSREFCIYLRKKQWVHKSELPQIIEGIIDGHDCKLSKTTGLPLGMIPDTNADNFKVRRGGYNCGDQFFWVPDSAVPADVKAKFESGGISVAGVVAAAVVIGALNNNNTTITAEHIKQLSKNDTLRTVFDDFDIDYNKYKQSGKAVGSTDLTGIDKYKLSEEEAKIVYAYTTHAHEEINNELYNNRASKTTTLFQELLNGVLAKLPNFEGAVVRNYKPEIDPAEFVKQYADNIGGHTIFRGFLSSSKKLHFSWGYKIKYHIISKTGTLIENVSSHTQEQEVLFESGTAFTIKKVEGYDVYLEEL